MHYDIIIRIIHFLFNKKFCWLEIYYIFDAYNEKN